MNGRLAAFSLGALLALTAAAPSPRAIGLVVEETGSWTVDGKPLHVHDEVAAGSVVSSVRNSGEQREHPHIVIVLDDGHTRSCDELNECPLSLPHSLGEVPSLWARILGIFAAQPDRFEPTLARGPGAALTKLDDTIASSASGIAEFGPLLAPLAPRADFTVTINLPDRWSPRDLPVRRSAAGSAPIPLAPGLYTVAVSDPTTEKPLATPAWVLVSPASDYRSVSQRFSEARKTVAAWPAEISGDTREAFLRAALEALVSPQ